MTNLIRDAYNVAAEDYRLNYGGIPARTEDIDRVLSYVNAANPVVMEIGCAYGREAEYIVTLTNRYIGIDISSAYIRMARAEVPKGVFEVADVMNYDFPTGIDVVFAFASLLHNPKEDLEVVLQRIEKVLNPGGVIFLSLKTQSEYSTAEVDDGITLRRFYYYTRETILALKPDTLYEVYYDEQQRQESWFTMILQKK